MRLGTSNQIENKVIQIRCPHCRHMGTFEPVGLKDVRTGDSLPSQFGIRRCPNPDCFRVIFFAHGPGFSKIFPPEVLEFDTRNVPPPVANAMTEAVMCHSQNCHIAAAIMVRKALEEICTDRKAAGGNLKAKIQALGGQITVPKELLEGMDELRLLGNDAAHVESQAFNQVGKEELDVAIEFTKEVIKATYQYEDLLARLRKLKK